IAMPWGTTTTHGGTSQRNREDLTRGTERRTRNKLDFRQTGDAPPKQSFQKYRKLAGGPHHATLQIGNREDLTRGTERRTRNKLDFRQTGDAPPKQSFQKYRKLGGVPLHGNL